MKKPLLLMLTAGILWPAQAQWFGPEAFTGAALGGVIGGVTGGHTYRHRGHYHRSFSGEGAAIGAGIGWLAGALMGEARRRDDYYAAGSVYVPAATANIGYCYTEVGHAGYVYYAPNAYWRRDVLSACASQLHPGRRVAGRGIRGVDRCGDR